MFFSSKKKLIELEINLEGCHIFIYKPSYSDAFSELGAMWCLNILLIIYENGRVDLFHVREGYPYQEEDIDNDLDVEEKTSCY